jgi:hypothetical protein
MRSANLFGRTMTRWRLLLENVKPHLAGMPHIQVLVAELEALVAEAERLDAEQEIARGKLRELIRLRRDAEKRGEGVRRRVGSHLKGTFGFTSEQLIQFGLNPRPSRNRSRKPAEPPVTATP